MERQARRQKKRKWKKRIMIFFLFILLIASATAFYVYHSVNKALDGESLNSEKRAGNLNFGQKEGFTVLLLGVDKREGDQGRSDTMILASVQQDSVKMLSIPRDTRVEIAEKGTEDKINHAYAFGGVSMAAKTVEEFLDVPVDYYVDLNMEGLESLVDAVGGVDVDSPFAFSYGGDHFTKGTIHLTGSEALNYARMRYEDPNGDFGRQERQRQVIQAVIKKGTEPQTVLKYGSVLGAIGSNVQTNLSLGDIAAIQRNYGSARNRIESETINGSGEKIDGVYYYIVPEQERNRLSEELKEHLGI